MSALEYADPDLVERAVLIEREQVAFVRYLLEAEDGLALLHSDGSGLVRLVAPRSQEAALDRLVADLTREGLVVQLR